MSKSFIVACEGGKRKIAEILIEKKQVDISYTDERGRTALHYAAHRGYLDLVRKLHAAGADINYEDHNGETPIFFALLQKQKQTALFLLEQGANININDFQGNSLLHIAARSGQQKVVEKLISGGLDVNAMNNAAETPLLLAVKTKMVPVVQLLARLGADVDITDKQGNSALTIAVSVNSFPIVNTLLDSGASVNLLNERNEGPLLLAVQGGNRLIARKLIEQGSDIFAESAQGVSPVWYVASGNQKELLALFLSKGLSPDYARPVDSFDGRDGNYIKTLTVRSGGKTFVLGFESHYAGETLLQTATKMGYLSLQKQLIDAGASINKKDASGNTALHYGAAYGKKDAVHYLLTVGAETDSVNVLEQKPIDYANIRGFNEITALLIDFGAKLNTIPDGSVQPGQTEKPGEKQGMDMSEKKAALFDLKELLDAGIISQSEFDQQKAKILGA